VKRETEPIKEELSRVVCHCVVVMVGGGGLVVGGVLLWSRWHHHHMVKTGLGNGRGRMVQSLSLLFASEA